MSTLSENLVSLANKEYAKKKIALVKKIDARMARSIYVASTGLDYIGIIKDGGKYLSFEVKETEKDYLPMQNIADVQIDHIRRLEDFNAEVFLLVYFKNLEEWYLLYPTELEQILSLNPTAIPIRYFQAFGFKITNEHKYPDYLNPERIAFYGELRKGFPDWINIKKEKIVEHEQIKIDYTNTQVREERLKKALSRGLENASTRQQRINSYKNKP